METPCIFADDLFRIQVLGGLVRLTGLPQGRIGLQAATFGVLEISADAHFFILRRRSILTVKEKIAENVVSFACLAIAASIVAQADIGLGAGAGVITRADTLRLVPTATAP